MSSLINRTLSYLVQLVKSSEEAFRGPISTLFCFEIPGLSMSRLLTNGFGWELDMDSRVKDYSPTETFVCPK